MNEEIIDLSKKLLLENGFEFNDLFNDEKITTNTIDTKKILVKKTTLPESIFKALKPSQNRYSLLNKIEL